MRGLHKFKVTVPADIRGAKVEMDGVELEGVVSVEFKAAVAEDGRGSILVVGLKVIGEVEIEGEFKPDEILTIRRERKV